MNHSELCRYLEPTFLIPTATEKDVVRFCKKYLKINPAGICIPPYYVRHVASLFSGLNIRLVTVAGFPHGNTASTTKLQDAYASLFNGADEIDMVMNISAFKSKKYSLVQKEIRAINEQALPNKLVKVIVETAYLNKNELVTVSKLVRDSGAAFIKTSTGFASSGARVEDVKIMKKVVGDKIQIKAAGGIRTYEQAIQLIEAGATRLGCSTPEKLLEGAKK